MEALARVKVAVRNVMKKERGPGLSGVVLLGYPAGGKQNVRSLPKDGRWAGQLRFKVLQRNGKLHPVVVHLPCRMPDELFGRLDRNQQDWLGSSQIRIWEQVHKILDRELTPVSGRMTR